MATTYFITGGAGNVACQLTFELQSAADRIILFDIVESPIAPVATNAIYVRGDLTDTGALTAAIDQYQPSNIVHAAALLSGASERDRRRAWRVNADATYELVEIALQRRAQMLFLSTVAIYGAGEDPADDGVQSPLSEWPVSLYGASKIVAERLGHYFHARHGLDFRALRLPIVISPYAPLGAATAYASRAFIEARQNGKYTFPVEPETRSPLIHLRDVALAVRLLLESPAESLSRRVYLIQSISPSAREIAEAIQRRLPQVSFDYQPDEMLMRMIEHWPKQPYDQPARGDWGWNPQFDLEESADQMLTR